jgi:hypothetical protein
MIEERNTSKLTTLPPTLLSTGATGAVGAPYTPANKNNFVPPEITMADSIATDQLFRSVSEIQFVSDTFNDKPNMVTKSPFKFNENQILKELETYLLSTYNQHYVGKNNIQVQDLVAAGDDKETIGFWKWNAVKYLSRYGRKKGHNRADLLKAMHYVVLLMYVDQRIANENAEG